MWIWGDDGGWVDCYVTTTGDMKMGYYTRHELEIIDGDIELIEELRQACEEAKYALEPNGDTYGETKWYSSDKDMKEFSKKHPNVLFKLMGEGEESGDIWHKYFRDGKMQTCKARIVVPEFNAEELK